MLVIHPEECIDCGVCQPECPADAIFPDSDKSQDLSRWLKVNDIFSKQWPNVTRARPHADDAKQFDGETGKFERYFSTKPGQGD